MTYRRTSGHKKLYAATSPTSILHRNIHYPDGSGRLSSFQYQLCLLYFVSTAWVAQLPPHTIATLGSVFRNASSVSPSHLNYFNIHYPLFYYSLFTIHYLLFTIYYSLFTIHYLLFTIHYSLFTIHYLLFTIYYSLFTIHYLLFTIYYLLFTVYYSLFTIYYSLFTVHCSLFTIHYLLFTIPNNVLIRKTG